MKVAIAGYGIEGKISYQYWSQRGDDVTIVDERDTLDDIPDGAQTLLGAGVFAQLDDFDLVIRTASLRPDRIHTSGKVWSATNEFFAACPAPIIGATGTKGKGTTCSFITSILRAAGKTVHLVGNIGVPALAVLPEIQPSDVVVYELSSFQLWDLERSPHIAVVLMIEPDHLDVHTTYAEYVIAKSQITQHQTADDSVLYHPVNPDARRIADLSPGVKYRYARDESVYIKDDIFWADSTPICSVFAVVLPGRHNRENACAAIAAVRQYDASIAASAIEQGLQNFTGLPHRLKFIREVNGVKYYDDSIATTPGSAIAALEAFDQPKIIILGGSDKGSSYESIVEKCKETYARVIAIGQTGEEIYRLCQAKDVESVRENGDMTAVIQQARQMAQQGDVVILSPASASFDMFLSYADRGDQFIAAVENL